MANAKEKVYKLKDSKKIKSEHAKRCLDLRDIITNESSILSLLDEDRFKSIKVETKNIAGEKEIIFYIVDDGMPVFQVNEFLDTKNNKNTRRKYSNILCRFLNYLNSRNLYYLDASNNEIEDYIKFRIYGGSDNLTLLKSNIGYKTIRDDISVIKSFYQWLSRRIKRLNMDFYTEERINKSSFLYAEIGATDYEDIISEHLDAFTESKEYIKWYTAEQVEAIVSNLRTKRDRAIFLCTVDSGMRIDEVLSTLRKDYNVENKSLVPSRTKSKKKRTLQLSDGTCNMINDYLIGERADAEYESNVVSPYLFINLNRGLNQGKPVEYHNFRKILRRAAKRAGLPEDQIRTHSGRSSKAMEYLKVQARYPELNLTDAQIALNMGWEKIDTIKHYRDRNNEELGLLAQEKILQGYKIDKLQNKS